MTDLLDNAAVLQLAQAQLDANRLKQDELNVERRRQAIQLQVIEGAASLSQEVRLLVNDLRESREAQTRQAIWIDRAFEDLANRIERLEHNMMLLLTENNPQKRIDASQEYDNEAEIRRQIKRAYKNLSKLQEQEAAYGSVDVPLKIVNGIEAERAKIEELRSRLGG